MRRARTVFVGRRPLLTLWPDGADLPPGFEDHARIGGRRVLRLRGTASTAIIVRETQVPGLKSRFFLGRPRKHDDADLIRLWLRGVPTKLIAFELGICLSIVSVRARNLGLPARNGARKPRSSKCPPVQPLRAATPVAGPVPTAPATTGAAANSRRAAAAFFPAGRRAAG